MRNLGELCAIKIVRGHQITINDMTSYELAYHFHGQVMEHRTNILSSMGDASFMTIITSPITQIWIHFHLSM
jgi:hypothetical protein